MAMLLMATVRQVWVGLVMLDMRRHSCVAGAGASAIRRADGSTCGKHRNARHLHSLAIIARFGLWVL
jgi:hypothetical protein